MKKVIFVRHGKAEDEVSGISDFERSLTVKGKIISGIMARRLSEKENSPGLIISSPAFRALETALLFAEEFRVSPDDMILKSDIYASMNFRNLKKILAGISDDINVVSFFGHNPSFTQLADSLSTGGCEFIPKSGVVCLSFNIMKWSELERKQGNTDYILNPEKSL